MPIIKTVVPPEEAQGKVKEAYAIFADVGMVPAPLQMFSPSPDLVLLRAQTIGYYLAQPHLSPALLALIRMLVAEELKYYYCISLNREGALKRWASWTRTRRPRCWPTRPARPCPSGQGPAPVRAQGGQDPGRGDAQDMQALKDLGWSDQDIFEATVQGAGMVSDGILFKAFKMDEAPAC